MASYNTNYSVFNSIDKSLIKTNNGNNSCYALWMHNNELGKFVKDRYIEVYYDYEALKNEELNNWWIKCLNEIGLKVTCKIKERKDYKVLPERVKADKFYVWKFNYNDYKSKSHLKVGLYLIREFFGYANPEKLLEAKKIYDKNKKVLNKFNSFLFNCFKIGSTTDHVIFNSGIIYRFLTNKEFNNIISNIKNDDMTYYNLKNSLAYLTDVNNVAGHSPRYIPLKNAVNQKLNINCSLKEYKLKLKELNNGK